MRRRTARGNRLGLALVGLLLLAGGAALLLARFDVIPQGSDQVVYPRTVQRFVADQQGWLYWVLGAVCAVLALWFLRWLFVQARVDRLGRMVVDGDDPAAGPGSGAGRTTLLAGAATVPVEEEIRALTGVRRVVADLGGHPDAPELWLTVVADADADLGRIRTRVTGEILPEARACLETPEMPCYLTLVVGRKARGARELA